MSDEVRFLVWTYGGAPGSTNWNNFTLLEIWQMLEHESGYINWEQYDAWRQMAELCQDQAGVLEKAIGALQQQWPAHPGSASESFGAVVRAFVGALRQTAADADTNKEAIGSITTDIGSARSRIASLIDQYRRYETAGRMLLPQPTPSPGQSVPAPVPEADRPPQNWRAMLDSEARQIMATTDAQLGTHCERLQAHTPIGWGDDGTPFDPNGLSNRSISGGSTAPYIPPPSYDPPSFRGMPSQGSSSNTNGDSTGAAGDGTVLDSSPGIPGPTNGAPLPSGSSTWLPLDAIGSGRPASGSGAAGLLPGVAVIGPAPIGGQVPAHASASPAGASARAGVSSGAQVPPPMAAAPIAQPGQRGGAVAPGGHTPGYRDRNRRRDPDDPWAPRQGNPAVIEPAPESGEHDPGPGVLGLDR